MVFNEMMFDPTFSRLESGLSELARRQAVIANNVANANTPGYQAQVFSQLLAEAEGQIGTDLLPAAGAAGAEAGPGTPAGAAGQTTAPAQATLNSGPGVVLEDQMAKLAENNLRYTSYIRLLNYKIAVLRKVVSQGRS